MTTNLSRGDKKQNYDLILRLTDISALLFIIVFFAFRYEGNAIAILSQIVFLFMSFVCAYLRGLKIDLLILWAVAFFGFCALSIIWAYTPLGADRIASYSIKSLSIVFAVLLYADTKRNAGVLMLGFIIGALILAVRLYLSSPIEEFGQKPLGDTIGFNENAIGKLFLYSSIICMHYSKKSKWYFLLFLLFALFSLLSGSRKAAVIMVGVLVMSFFNKVEKPAHILYIVPFGAAIAALIYLLFNNEQLYHMIGRRLEYLLNYFNGEGDVGRSTLIRMDLISIGFEQFKEKPILGYGFNTFRYMNRYGLYAHNNYIELLVDTGIVGTALFYSAHLIMLVKAIIIWLKKTRDIIPVIMFIVVTLACDLGSVSYFNEITLVLLALSYKLIILADEDKNPALYIKKELTGNRIFEGRSHYE